MKNEETLSNEELMEVLGGFSKSSKSSIFIPVAAYAAGAFLPGLINKLIK